MSKRAWAGLAFCVGLCATAPAMALPAAATEDKKPAVEWVFPVIPKFGGVHPRDDLAVRPDPAKDYRILVQVVSAAPAPDKPNPALIRLARLVNLMGYAKVPSDHVHIVAVLDREAAMNAGTDAAFARFAKLDHNPNLPILHALKGAGVELMVCSQAMAEHGIPDDAISPDVTITLSALTDFAVYGERGYSFMQL